MYIQSSSNQSYRLVAYSLNTFCPLSYNFAYLLLIFSNKNKKAIVILSWYNDIKKRRRYNERAREREFLLTMSDEIVPDLSNENENHPTEEKEEASQKSDEESSTPTVTELDDVQSFCAEFHIKVENAAGIRPWLQFSDTSFPGKIK